MAERMTSVEIEDVLTSIRRLVTEDLRPKPAAADDKLILTPALRVVPQDQAASAEPLAQEDAAEPTLDVDLDADLATALSEAQADEITATLDAGAEYDGPMPMFLHHTSRVHQPAAAAPDTSGWTETVTTIGAGIPAEGFEAELGDVMPVPEWPESSWVAPDVIDEVQEAEVIVAAEQVQPQAADWAEDPVQGADDSTALDDAAEAAALAALAAEEAAQDDAGLTELDEEMLREIVREIIREELQGTLGERITRNVRKLVRAEINRALITQDLE